MHVSPLILMFPPPTPKFPKGGGPGSREGRLWGGEGLSEAEGPFPQQSYRTSSIWNAVK